MEPEEEVDIERRRVVSGDDAYRAGLAAGAAPAGILSALHGGALRGKLARLPGVLLPFDSARQVFCRTLRARVETIRAELADNDDELDETACRTLDDEIDQLQGARLLLGDTFGRTIGPLRSAVLESHNGRVRPILMNEEQLTHLGRAAAHLETAVRQAGPVRLLAVHGAAHELVAANLPLPADQCTLERSLGRDIASILRTNAGAFTDVDMTGALE